MDRACDLEALPRGEDPTMTDELMRRRRSDALVAQHWKVKVGDHIPISQQNPAIRDDIRQWVGKTIKSVIKALAQEQVEYVASYWMLDANKLTERRL